jgi:hypothetical protein
MTYAFPFVETKIMMISACFRSRLRIKVKIPHVECQSGDGCHTESFKTAPEVKGISNSRTREKEQDVAEFLRNRPPAGKK